LTCWRSQHNTIPMNLRPRNKVNPAFNMSSMTDLVFLLLIFFIILSTMVSPYSLPVDLPTADSKGKPGQKVSLRIGPDLVYSVNNKKIDESEVEVAIARELKNSKDKSVIMKIDKSVPSGMMVEVLGIAKRNNWKIVVATKP